VTDWFSEWFQEDYLQLYGANRTSEQAVRQVNMVLSYLPSPPRAVLDCACGSGRHLRAFQELGIWACGFDLSMPLLMSDAQGHAKNTVRADFRQLPFAPESFDLVCSFFSSFGYLKTAQEDLQVLQNMVDLLQKGGYLFLDLINAASVLPMLPNENTLTLKNGSVVVQKRYVEGDCICKDIIITPGLAKDLKGAIDAKDAKDAKCAGDAGNAEGVKDTGGVRTFKERLRMWDKGAMTSFLQAVGLHVVQVWGDEQGAAFDEKNSPRMTFLARRG
jgi:SAM-dependent methyltransferase